MVMSLGGPVRGECVGTMKLIGIFFLGFFPVEV